MLDSEFFLERPVFVPKSFPDSKQVTSLDLPDQ